MIQNIRLYLLFVVTFIYSSTAFAANPVEDCWGHPLCGPSWNGGVFNVIGDVIATGIQYVAVIAVIAVMIGGIMYILSSWDEEKTKKAKNIIIWALVGVFLSVSAMALVNIVNNFRII